MSIADIGREAAEASTAERDDDGDTDYENEYDRTDVGGASFIKMHPGPTAVEATITGLRYFAPYSDGEFDDEGRGETYVLIENPTLPDDEDLSGVSIFESTTGSGDDFKVVNADDDSVDVYNAGVSVGQMFESDEVDEFGIDGMGVLKLSTGAGRSVARTLDVKGLPNADVVRTETGDPEIQSNGYPTSNLGLVEKHPRNDEDGFYEAPRFARDPQIRPDVEGQRAIILVQHMADVVEDYDGNAHWATVLVDMDDDRQAELAQSYADDSFYAGDSPEDFIRVINGEEFINLGPTAEFEPDEDLVYSTNWLEWNYPSDSEIEALQSEQDWKDE